MPTKSAFRGRVPYLEVHELLRANGYDLKKSVTEKLVGGGETLHRIYVPVEGAPAPLIHFPVKRKTISQDHYEKIKEMLHQRRKRRNDSEGSAQG